jgi:hypothetical protein
MNNTKLLAISGKAGIVLNAVLLLTLSGCGGSADSSGPVVQAPPPPLMRSQSPADAQAPPSSVIQVAPPAELAQDNYVYYPDYGIYYGSGRRQYASLQGTAWVSEPAPRGVAVGVLQASTSVKMDFHDAPANHHAAIAKQYPKNWKPASAN